MKQQAYGDKGSCIKIHIQRKTHSNVKCETDVTVGPILKRMADSAGVVYTVSAGDEPGAKRAV